jgi:WD40 repeat protein
MNPEHGRFALLDSANGKLISEVNRGDNPLETVFSRDGKRLVTWPRQSPSNREAAPSSALSVISVLKVGEELREQYQLTVPGVKKVFLGEDHDVFVSLGDGETLTLWDGTGAAPIAQVRSLVKIVQGARVTRDHRNILVWGSVGYVPFGGIVGAAQLISFFHHPVPTCTETGDESKVLTDGSLITGALFDRSESRILTWSGEESIGMFRGTAGEGKAAGNVILWDATTKEPISGPMRHEGPVRGALFDATERRILSWDGDYGHPGTVRLWNSDGKELFAPLHHEHPVEGARLVAGETAILSWTSMSVHLWDASSGRALIKPLWHSSLSGAVLNEEAHLILTWSRATSYGTLGSVRIWDARSGDPITREIKITGLATANFLETGKSVLVWSTVQGPIKIALPTSGAEGALNSNITDWTGTKYDASTRELKIISGQDWRKRKDR